MLNKDPFSPNAHIDTMLQWLVDTAAKHAEERAHRVYIEEQKKVVLGLAYNRLMYGDKTTAADRERLSFTDKIYIEYLPQLREAIEKDEANKMLRSAIHAKVEIWRSKEASDRALQKHIT